jgi:alpha-galactosidase
VVAVFANPVVGLGETDRSVYLVNGTESKRLVVEGAGDGPVELVVSDCSGVEVHREAITPPPLWAIDVPVAGMARIVRT